VAIGVPQTRYTKSRGTRIAYQVFGAGEHDLLLVPGFVSHVEHQWSERNFARFLRRLGSFCRVVAYDKRGTGLSDRDTATLTFEDHIDDVHAVMAAAGIARPFLFAQSSGGPLAMVLAATRPADVAGLILWSTFASARWATDYPWGLTDEQHAAALDAYEQNIDKGFG
jgi:pimeloyl-ACP methyl ester carboxylesterase